MTDKHIYTTCITVPARDGLPCRERDGPNADMRPVSALGCPGPAGEIQERVALQPERRFI